MADHTESVQVDYDPSIVSYEQLLELFWNNHNPFTPMPRQYMSAIWYHNEQQKQAVDISKAKQKAVDSIKTVIKPLGVFTIAEDYHQKYYLRSHESLIAELNLSGNDAALRDSFVAARLNGFIGGYGDASLFEKELALYKLSEKGVAKVEKYIRRGSGASCGR